MVVAARNGAAASSNNRNSRLNIVREFTGMLIKRFLALVLFSASAYAQGLPPVIRNVVPSSGPATGGTTVSITGDHLGLPPNFACVLPCPAKVIFGDSPAVLLQEADTLLVVRTSAHGTGTVDVKVVTGDNRTVTASNAFTYVDDQEANYQRILLPIYLESPVPGSSGSLWKTQLWLRNNGSVPITLAPWTCPRGALCVPTFPLTRQLQPDETLLNLPVIPQANAGRLLYVSRDNAGDLSAGLRLFEASRSQSDAGTEIPIVREDKFLTKASHFHSVPLYNLFRVNVRIYEMGVDDAQFQVSVSEETEGTSNAGPLRTDVVHAIAPESGTFREHPGYGEFTSWPALATANPVNVRIDVQPLTAGSRYWAFVSITNNDTQRVTLVTPQ